MTTDNHTKEHAEIERKGTKTSRSAESMAKVRQSKYRAIKTEIDGIVFDSKREAARYVELRYAMRAGRITGLKYQVRFQLLPGCLIEGDKRKTPALCYVADFVYRDAAGDQVVEDVKGVRLPMYKLKRRLMWQLLGLRITEV